MPSGAWSSQDRGAADDVFGAPAQRVGGAWEQGKLVRNRSTSIEDHVAGGATLDQVREGRENWLDFEFHFDLRLEIEGKRIYFETVLVRADPRDPLIEIVNVHLA
ncbi:MAG TPA: hypothetical protein VMV69_04595 [Pirellulales bacterium]|nr:hypothetical protein [Pirellulales bacterium]